MAIKLSGMISGLDTDAMIDELVSAYSTKKDNIFREQKTLSYKQDAWKTLNTKIYSLFSGSLSNLRFSSNYQKKAASASSAKATVKADNSAVNGVQSLKITSLARSGYLTGGKLDGSYTGSSKMSEFGVTSDTRINVSVNGKNSYIDVTADMSVDQFTTRLKEAGLNASFDSTNQRFFISSKDSGASNDFSLSGNSEQGNNLLRNMGIYNVSTADINAYKKYISAVDGNSNYMSDLAKDEYLNSILSSIKNSYSAENSTKQSVVKENTSKIKEYNKEISFAKSSDKDREKTLDSLSKNVNTISEKLAAKNEAISNETDEEKKATLQKEIDALESQFVEANENLNRYRDIDSRVGSTEGESYKENLEAFEAENKGYISDLEEENTALNEEIKANKEIISEIEKTMSGSIQDKENYLNNGSYDYDYNSAEYEKVYQQYVDKYNTAVSVVEDYDKYQALNSLGDAATDAQKAERAALSTKLGLDSSSTGAVRIEGSDAKIYLNGAEFTSNTNNFSINGLTITANALTDEDEEITITTNTDVDAIYDMVKSFFSDYNSLINEMDSLYNAASAGDYKPLTEDEESEMSDKQIEKWETKLTDAALRKDGTLSSVISLMKTAMSQGFVVNGKTYSLSSFGIKTLGYFQAAENEKGAYHIDGDADDSAVSGKTDKLRSAIANDPETFVSFFSQLTSNLYSKLNSKMASSSLSSAYTVYNDKSMTKQYGEYTKSLKNWDTKIESMREKYEKQFASMEKALSTLTNQQSQLSSLLGG